MTSHMFRTIRAAILVILVAGCGVAARVRGGATSSNEGAASDTAAVQPTATAVPDQLPPACCLAIGLDVARQFRVAAITKRTFTHAELWRAIAPSLRGDAIHDEEIGRSMHGRSIRALRWGRGPIVVLLWSQMHGDESTATMALADLLAYFAAPDSALSTEARALRTRLDRAVSLVMIPMLNPDGAERFQRENAAGIDINRDARRLSSPEARILNAARERYRPAYGFNLHDQGFRTLAGRRGAQTAIALSAPPSDASGLFNDVRQRARRVAATMAAALAPELPSRMARYDDSFNARAFGDLMQRDGVSTILVESGVDPVDPEKQRLRALNVAALLTAFEAIAFGARVVTTPYDSLPYNTGADADVLIMGGSLVVDSTVLLADVAVMYDDPRGRTGARLREIGDLTDFVALDTIRAAGQFVHIDGDAGARIDGREWVLRGRSAVITVRATRGGQVIRTVR